MGKETSSEAELFLKTGYFGFKPILGIEVAALVVYSILTICVLYLNVRKRTWFMMPIVVGGALEIFGFAWRIWETSNDHSEVGFILYLVPVLVAPTVLAAADYALASVVMTKANTRIRFFSPKVTKYLFLVCDIAAFLIQGMGGSIAGSAKTQKQQQLGSNIVLFGLGISLAVFIIFLFLSVGLHVKIRKSADGTTDLRWMKIFYVVYANMTFLSIRAIYRVAEFGQKNYHNKLSDNEVYFYFLDCLLMILLIAVWVPWHPSVFGLTKDTIHPIPDDEKKTKELTVVSP